MGILNLTDDSFYDGGRFNSEKKHLIMFNKCLMKEPTLLILAGTHLGPTFTVSLEDEWERLENNLKNIRKEFPQHTID